MSEISKISFEKIATDTNAILSATVTKVTGVARRIFAEASGVTFVTTTTNMEEVRKHLPTLVDRYGIALDQVLLNLAALPVVVYDEPDYESHRQEAARYLRERDLDDVPLAALALKYAIPIWSNDRDFSVLPLPVFSTGQLLKALGLEGEPR